MQKWEGGATVICKIFTVELFSFCAIINEIKLEKCLSVEMAERA